MKKTGTSNDRLLKHYHSVDETFRTQLIKLINQAITHTQLDQHHGALMKMYEARQMLIGGRA